MKKEDKKQEELMKKYPNGMSLQDQVYEFEGKWKKDNLKHLISNIFGSFMLLSFVGIFIYSIYDWNLDSFENIEAIFGFIMMYFIAGLFFFMFIFTLWASIDDFRKTNKINNLLKQLAEQKNKKKV